MRSRTDDAPGSVALTVTAAAIAGRTQLARADSVHVVAAIATGLLGGAVPFLAFNRAIRDLTVAHAGLLLNLDPVLAAAGAVLLGEQLRWPEIAGGVLVVAAATAIVAPEALVRRPRDTRATSAGRPPVGDVPCPSSP